MAKGFVPTELHMQKKGGCTEADMKIRPTEAFVIFEGI